MIILLSLACTSPDRTTTHVDIETQIGDTGQAPRDTGLADTDTGPTDSGHDSAVDTGTADTGGHDSADTGGGADTAPDTDAPPARPECWDGSWVDDFGNPIAAGVGMVGTDTADLGPWIVQAVWMDESTHSGTWTLPTCGDTMAIRCETGLVTMTMSSDRADFGGTITYTATQNWSVPYDGSHHVQCDLTAWGTIDGVDTEAIDGVDVWF